MKKLLIAIDGSPSSMKALDTGLELAKRINAHVCILTVAESLSSYALAAEINTSAECFQAREVLLKDHKAYCQSLLETSSKKFANAGLDAESMLAIGAPAEEILSYAEQKGCDLIVLGSRGLGAAKGLIMGSVSNKIVHRAACNVLVVKE